MPLLSPPCPLLSLPELRYLAFVRWCLILHYRWYREDLARPWLVRADRPNGGVAFARFTPTQERALWALRGAVDCGLYAEGLVERAPEDWQIPAG